MTQGMVAAVLCGLTRDQLPPFAYATLAITLSAALVAIPLLGELGFLLRADPAEAWVSALPTTPLELKLARSLHLLLALAVLALGALVPAVLLAPSEFGLLGRLALLAAGIAGTFTLAAVLLLGQGLLGGRLEGLLVLLQTLLVVGVVAGFAMGLEYIPHLSTVRSHADLGGALACWPGAWAALPWSESATTLDRGAPLLMALVALSIVALVPPPAAVPPRSLPGPMERALAPLRCFAERFWLRKEERGPFRLVYEALPREREVVLRTVPLLGIPLAFLLAGSIDSSGPRRDGLLTLLLFTAGTYLPVLLSQVPASASHQASWLLETAPIPPKAIAGGAVKALALRFIAPLYVTLLLLTWLISGAGLALRLAPPSALVSLLALRALYPRCVAAPPLSQPPDRTRGHEGQGEAFFGLAFVLTICAALAVAYLTTPLRGALATLALLALEISRDRKLHSSPGSSRPAGAA